MTLTEEDIDFIKAHMADGLIEQSLGMLDRFAGGDKRLDMIDQRFVVIDKRPERVDERFDEMIHRHDCHFQWLIGFISTAGALIVAAVKLW